MKRLLTVATAVALSFAVPAGAQQASQPVRPQPERRAPAKPVPAKPPAPTPAASGAGGEHVAPASLGAPASGLPAGAQPFGNWIFSCASQNLPDGNTVKACNMRTSLVVEDPQTKQQSVAASVIVARSVADKQTQLIMQLPLSSLLLMRPRVLGAEGKPVAELAWVACNQQMCISSVTLTDTQLALLRKSSETLSVVYRTQSGQDIKIDGSSKGIVEGLNALAQEK